MGVELENLLKHDKNTIEGHFEYARKKLEEHIFELLKYL